jgi:hypothetical protein
MYITADICKNEIYKEYISPDKALKAIVFQRDCGATTGFSTQISILKSNEDLDNNEGGNIFIIKGEPNKVAPTLNWINNNTLYIDYSLNGNEFKANDNYGWLHTISIKYNNKKL